MKGADGSQGSEGSAGPNGSRGVRGPRPQVLTVPQGEVFGARLPRELDALIEYSESAQP